ncbi:MAG: D-aminoacyl-tRNA deacylase [Desulfobacteraceae bacterium]|nr:D-aminoacyl-tRNA deacylase [Desulfobacteraceae bacterium]
MRAVVQLVSRASVTVDSVVVGSIGPGLAVLLGVHREDAETDALQLAEKIANLRIFPDERGLMNRSLLEQEGELLVISQFTLFGDCRKGRRPSFSQAAPSEPARALYERFCRAAADLGVRVATGQFQAMMEVSLTNNGPVTLLLDSGKLF